ncbi:MAG: DUF2263 domain-containing protein [Balneolaceae bacterium]|nr:DUF2263 domain-containing protein [Balneolaceae bacterium]
MDRKAIAKHTLQILEQGRYRTPDGHTVDLEKILNDCITGTECYTPEQLGAIRSRVLEEPVSPDQETEVVVSE